MDMDTDMAMDTAVYTLVHIAPIVHIKACNLNYTENIPIMVPVYNLKFT